MMLQPLPIPCSVNERTWNNDYYSLRIAGAVLTSDFSDVRFLERFLSEIRVYPDFLNLQAATEATKNYKPSEPVTLHSLLLRAYRNMEAGDYFVSSWFEFLPFAMYCISNLMNFLQIWLVF